MFLLSNYIEVEFLLGLCCFIRHSLRGRQKPALIIITVYYECESQYLGLPTRISLLSSALLFLVFYGLLSAVASIVIVEFLITCPCQSNVLLGKLQVPRSACTNAKWLGVNTCGSNAKFTTAHVSAFCTSGLYIGQFRTATDVPRCRTKNRKTLRWEPRLHWKKPR